MALPPAAPERQLKHRRSINVQIFARGGGLWEVDAEIADVKTRDAKLAGGMRRAGDTIHDMLLRLIVDEQFNIVEAGSETRWMPYPGHCDDHGDAYAALAGLNLLKGFRQAVRERLGGVIGCTHLTELTQVLPTAVVQAFAGEVLDTREAPAGITAVRSNGSRENTLAEKAENTGDMVTVTVRQHDRSFEIHSKTAIAADGVNSRIVDQLGLNKDRKFFAQFHVVTYYMENVSCPYPPAWMVFVGRGHTPSGMGQLYMHPKPREKGRTVYEVTYGCPITDRSAIKNDLDWFVSQGRFSRWFKIARCIKTLSAVLRFHTPLTEPVADRILVAGDAASFIEVYMQGAIMYGYKAAQSIINFLQHGTGFNDYTAFWKKTYGYNQPGSIEAATQAFGLHVLEDAEVDYLFSLTDREEHSGYVIEFSDRENIMKALLSHSDEIKRDKPALAAKLDNFDKRSVKELLQVN